MRDGWLTTAELLARTHVPGKRPDAVLKRLRREGILARPRRGKGRGRARGVTWWYPPGSDRRLGRVLELRDRRLRAFRELRWQLWFEGAADIWERLKVDLLAAYPADVRRALEALATQDADSVGEAIAEEAPYLAAVWLSRPLPTGEPNVRVSSQDQGTLGHVVIGAAIRGHALPLDAPLDDVEGKTTGELVEATWGAGSSATHTELVSSGGSDARQWEEALRTASSAEAARAAELMRRTLNPRLLQREMRLFNDEWGERALHVAGLIHALRSISPV